MEKGNDWSPEKYLTAVNFGGLTPIWGLLGYWSCVQLCEVWLQLLRFNKISTEATGSKQMGLLVCGVTTGTPDRVLGFASCLKPSQREK